LGDLRKDYVLDRFVVVPGADQAAAGAKPAAAADGKCPYCPGNESMTEPAMLALVVKDGLW
jgi:UDPglucose--hexose-1-phosphate uridylyltransferase